MCLLKKKLHPRNFFELGGGSKGSATLISYPDIALRCHSCINDEDTAYSRPLIVNYSQIM